MKNFLRFALALADKDGMIRAEREGDIMSSDGTYNGYVNYQTWNVCLWIANDEGLYDCASQCDTYEEFKRVMRDSFGSSPIGFETPDNVSWNDSGVNLAEMEEFWEENFSKVAA